MVESSPAQTDPTVDVDDSPGSRTPMWSIVLPLLGIWLGVSVARLMHAEPLNSANDRSRWCTVWSLVEEGTYQIDTIRRRPGWDTIDLVKHEGHFYSTKPPLLSTLVAGLYWLEKQTLGWTLDEELNSTSRVLLLFVNVLPMLLALALLARLLRPATSSPFTVAFVMATACFGTLLCPFLNVLNNHTPGAVSVIFALCAAVPLLSQQRRQGWLFAMAGFWAACACCVELPAAAFGLALFILLFRRDPRRTLLWFVPAALIPLGAFFYTNYLATGGWKPFYLYYGTEKYEFIHNGIPSYWVNPRGIDQAKDSPLVYFLHCTVGHHGVLSLSPVFLLTIFGWLTFGRWKDSQLKVVHWLGLGLTVLVFGFFLSKTENYNYGGVSVALRWLLWLVPFWLLAMVPLLERWRPGRVGGSLCVVLLSISAFSAWYPFESPWTQPWLFNLMTEAGWIDYSDPPPPEQKPFRTWIRQLPAGAGEDPQEDYWVEFEGLDADGLLRTLRLSDAGGRESESGRLRDIRIVETIAGEVAKETLLSIDVAAFAADLPVERQLPLQASDADAIELLRGLPNARPYAPGKLKYLGSPLRQEAFQTRHAASRVLATRRDHPRPTIYRRDIWATSDVPFGVLEFRVTLQDARSGEVVRQSTMRAVAAGRVRKFDPQTLLHE